MTILFWIDIAALCTSTVLACALSLTVLGAGIRAPANRSFVLFAAMEAFWAVSALLLRLSLWLHIGSPLLLGELTVLAVCLMSIALLGFAARYIGRSTRWADIACLLGLGWISVFSVFLFRHRIVLRAELLANGSSVLTLSRFGLFLAPVTLVFLFCSLYLFWSNRRRLGEQYFVTAVLVLLIGILAKGILKLPFPVLPITNTIGVSLLGFGVISRQLLNPLREREARLRLVNRVAAAVGRSLEIDVLMETVYREVSLLFRSDAFFVALYDERRDELEFRLQVDEGIREPPERQRLGTGLTSWVIQHKRALLIGDFDRLPRGVPKPKLYGTLKMPASWLGVPMLVGDKVIGVLSIQTYQSRPYGVEEQLLLTTIADQVAVAVQNARLYETVAQELSERRHTERELRDSEEKFRNLAEQSPSMIFINRGGRVVYANRKCEEVMGYSRDEFYNPEFQFLCLIGSQDIQRISSAFARHTAGEEVPPYEYQLVTKGGQRLDAIITTKLISYGRQAAILGIVTDISARKRTERLLQALNSASSAMEQADSPEAIFSSAGQRFKELGFYSVVFLLDRRRQSFDIHYSSYDEPVVEKLEALTGMDWREISLPVVEGAAVEKVIREKQTVFTAARESLKRLFPQFDNRRVEQMIRILRISKIISAPLMLEEEVMGVLSVQSEDLSLEDIPAITAFANQMAAAWRKSRLVEDLKESLDELKATQEQLLQAHKMEAVGKLAGGIAHDFNNMLTAIKGYTELLLRRTGGDDSLHGDLLGIKKASEQAARLTRQLLAFSRKQVLQPRVIDMNEIIVGMQEMLRRLIGEHIALVPELQEGLFAVRADPGQIEQVILNLAVNARDAMSGGGTLTVRTSNVLIDQKRSGRAVPLDAGDYVALTVMDTGSGMDEETRRRSFEPFFTTKETGKGTGLGLATVYGIVRQSGGGILVDSNPGEGTTFTIYLPRVQSRKEPPARRRKAARTLRGSETILLVEDEQAVRELAGRVLREYGYRVLVCSDAAQAVETAGTCSDPIELMVTDVVIPGGMNGKQLADRMVRDRPDMKVLYISGYADGSLFSAAEQQGQIQLLEKPFAPEPLAQTVRQILDGE